MKTPPFLLGATLVFWGWQSGLFIPGVILALILEGARLTRLRWDLSDDDFSRVWAFCSLMFLAAAVYGFAANEGPSDFKVFFQNHSLLPPHSIGIATARTTFSLARSLPMIFFLFIAAQTYSVREAIPLHVISLIQRYRWKAARKRGLSPPAGRMFNISYPYFAICLFSASLHASENTSFFWGFCLLIAWALWPLRSPRFALLYWIILLSGVIALSYFGQRTFVQFQNYVGNLNPQWLGGFARRRFDPIQSQTEIGTLGRIKTSPRIVIRLESKSGVPPRKLRETSYNTFKRRTWSSGITINDFSRVAETNETTFLLLNKQTIDSVKIACFLAGGKALLPLPETVGRLENLLAYNVWKSPLGAVLEEGPGLVVFDAWYGSGNSLDSPPGDQNEDLATPDQENPALDQVISELRLLPGQNVEQVLQTLATFFSTQFTYTTWQDQDRSHHNESQVTRFLLQTRSGHCEYFATAATLLLRRLGIPARYAVGYAVHEGSGQNYVVRQWDAHAWCLVWDMQRSAWHDFDPTPATWVTMDSQRVTLFQKLSDLWARVSFEISKFRWGQSHVRQYILWALVPVLALLFYQIVFRMRRRRRNAKGTGNDEEVGWPGLDSEFYQLENQLSEYGWARGPSEPLREWLRRVGNEESLMDLRNAFQELLTLHYRYRFDPRGLSVDERERLRERVRFCLKRIQETHEQVAVESA
jgi:hypothetical protein